MRFSHLPSVGSGLFGKFVTALIVLIFLGVVASFVWSLVADEGLCAEYGLDSRDQRVCVCYAHELCATSPRRR